MFNNRIVRLRSYKKKICNDEKNEIRNIDVLEHVPKDRELDHFKKIYFLLERDGIAYVTTPSKNIKIFPNFLRKWIGKKWGHEKCLGYTKDELEHMIRKAKITDCDIYSYQARYYLNSYLLIRLMQTFLSESRLKRLLLSIAKKDAKFEKDDSRGFYFVRIKA